MTVDPAVIPGLLLLAAELGVLAAVGYVVVRVALRQDDDRVALAQGLVVGLALWGLIVNLIMYAVPGLAGAAVGWAVMLALGAGLAWRAPTPLRPQGRMLAGFAIAVLALIGIALASRQLLSIPDAAVHLGMAASLRAGGFPPELPWNPGMAAPYHYGIDLLIGLLAPPVGPDLAFVTELFGAYAWTGFTLVVITALLRRASGFAVLVTAPLLLTAGAWTLLFGPPPYVLQLPVPEGIPTAGIRAALTDIYLPFVQVPLPGGMFGGLPDIWKPNPTLAYALAFVVLAHAARAGRRSRLEALTLAGLVGFVGLLASTLAPFLLVMWAGLEGLNFLHSRRAGSVPRAAMLWSGAGLMLAALLLIVGGGRLAGILDGQVGSGLSFEGIRDLGSRRLLGSFDSRSGGVGVLGIGPVLVAGVAALLARRDRLVLALAMGAGALLLARLVLSYEPFQPDLTRLDGHARNLALLALLLALSAGLTGLRPARWRYAAGGLLVTLITWPTVAEPVRNLSQAIGHGVVVANAQTPPRELAKGLRGRRFRLDPLPADGVAAYVRSQTAVDARVLSPHAARLTFATGRPNASGFAQHQHLFPVEGPSYRDAIEHLEPAATRRLGIAYVHATDAWVAGLPDRAARWLANPSFFELLVRDGAEALYRVRPEFLRLDAPPVPTSFEALRQAVPASTAVYLPPVFGTLPMLRVAASLPHARLLGYVDPAVAHVLTSIPIEPLSRDRPDLVVTPTHLVPWMLPPAGRQPIWWNDEVAVYAPNGAVAPIMPPPLREEPLAVSVQVSDVRAADGRIAFTATFDNRAPERWTGQDWVVIAVDASPWDLPLGFQPDSRTPVAAAWFDGWLGPSAGTTTHTYEFDALASRLAVEDGSGEFTAATGAGRIEGEGAWLLAIRLRHEYRPNYWRDAALIPVLRIMASEAGEVSYQVYADPLAARPLP